MPWLVNLPSRYIELSTLISPLFTKLLSFKCKPSVPVIINIALILWLPKILLCFNLLILMVPSLLEFSVKFNISATREELVIFCKLVKFNVSLARIKP